MAEQKSQSSESSKTPPADPRFPVAQLIEQAPDLLGYEPYEASGALHDAKGDLTISAAKAKVEKWLSSPVEEG